MADPYSQTMNLGAENHPISSIPNLKGGKKLDQLPNATPGMSVSKKLDSMGPIKGNNNLGSLEGGNPGI
jgi:hypothetical protein